MTSIYEYALLAADVYNDEQQQNFESWHIPQHEILKPRWRGIYNVNLYLKSQFYINHLSQQQMKPISTGFFARLYGNLITHESIVAYRGTVPGKIGDDLADFDLTFKMTSNEVLNAHDFFYACHVFLTSDIQQSPLNKGHFNPVMSVTGHSLGGYLAQTVATEFRAHAVVFNAPGAGGLHDPYVGYLDTQNSLYHNEIYNIDTDADWIHTVGEKLGQTQTLHDPFSLQNQCLDSERHLNSLAPQTFYKFYCGISNFNHVISDDHSILKVIQVLDLHPNISQTVW